LGLFDMLWLELRRKQQKEEEVIYDL